jgi:small nuclear ribonucleoprotein (snRNP)-like protein
MNSKYLRSGLALLSAAVLAACGGGNGNIALGVTVSGLSKDGLVLQNGNDTVTVNTGGGVVYFPTLLSTDQNFNITLKTIPENVQCTLANGSGRINYFTQLQATVSCFNTPYDLGGTATGLTSGVLVLANGSATVSLPAGTTTWKFPAQVSNGALYGISVLNQPAGLTCTVANGSGTMPTANVTTVAVTCRPAA